MSQDTLRIIFDDQCGVCTRSSRLLRGIDWFGQYELIPRSESADLVAQYNIPVEDPDREMNGVYEDTVYRGFDLFYLIVRRHPVLMILTPLFWLLKLTGLGPWGYRLFARNRYKLSQCLLPEKSTGSG